MSELMFSQVVRMFCPNHGLNHDAARIVGWGNAIDNDSIMQTLLPHNNMITFSDEDLEGIEFAHNDPLFVTMTAANTKVDKIFVDIGASGNTLSLLALKRMGLSMERDVDSSMKVTNFDNFGGESIYPGIITLSVTAGTEPRSSTVYMDFSVSVLDHEHDIVLGRSGLYALRAVSSTYHLLLRFPTKAGIGQVKGNQLLAREGHKKELMRMYNLHASTKGKEGQGGIGTTKLFEAGLAPLNQSLNGDVRIQMEDDRPGNATHYESSEPVNIITFSDEDLEGIEVPHNDELVVSMTVANTRIDKILVDAGATYNTLSVSALNRMGLSVERDVDSSKPVMVFGGFGKKGRYLGQIILSVTAGTEPKSTTVNMVFFVVDSPFQEYDIILGRPGLHAMRAVPSTYHLLLCFPTKAGIGKVRGDQRLARVCYYRELCQLVLGSCFGGFICSLYSLRCPCSF